MIAWLVDWLHNLKNGSKDFLLEMANSWDKNEFV